MLLLRPLLAHFQDQLFQCSDGVLRRTAHLATGQVSTIHDQCGHAREIVILGHLGRPGCLILNREGIVGVDEFLPIDTLPCHPVEQYLILAQIDLVLMNGIVDFIV